MTVYSFAPVSTPKAQVLILGSMPGIKSLTQQEYYAHPHNSFWPVMAKIFNSPIESYPQKIALIRNYQLALWDVLKACTREGSLDQSIDKNSIVPNDFSLFFVNHPHVTQILFNGGAAHDIFMRYVWKNLDEDIRSRLSLHKMPSTSPAMASLTREQKTSIWRDALNQARTSAS